MKNKITGWHFDPRDTDQQRAILRRSRMAQRVRRDFPQGTKVVSSVGVRGVVDRHVPGTSADGGTLVITWQNGRTGRHTLTSHAIHKVEEGA